MSVDTLVAQAIATEIGPLEPWPENALVYQPDEVSQIVLPDQATCLAVKTFLEMCGLGYIVEYRTNAEEMSPSGRVPFLQAGAFLISELDPIIAFVNTKGFSLSSELGDEERSELRAYMSLIDSVLLNAECYLAWCDELIYTEVTRCRYGSVHPWPLSSIIPMRKRWEVTARLKTTGWTQKTMNEVCDEVIMCCQALSERLDRQDYFFGDKPTELDALVYGHLSTILTANIPDKRLGEIVRGYERLNEFCARIEKKYYSNLKTIKTDDRNTNANDLEIVEMEDIDRIEKEEIDDKEGIGIDS